MTPLKFSCVNQPYLTSWVFTSDELSILFLLLLLYKSNELLILSSFTHFLLCVLILYHLNLLSCTALGSSISISAMPFYTWIAAGLSHSGYLTVKHSKQKQKTACWAVLSNRRALQGSWHSVLLQYITVTSCPPQSLIPQTWNPPYCQWSEVAELLLLTPSSSPLLHTPIQVDPLCFLRGFAQPRWLTESPAAVESFTPALASFVSQW